MHSTLGKKKKKEDQRHLIYEEVKKIFEKIANAVFSHQNLLFP